MKSQRTAARDSRSCEACMQGSTAAKLVGVDAGSSNTKCKHLSRQQSCQAFENRATTGKNNAHGATTATQSIDMNNHTIIKFFNFPQCVLLENTFWS